MPKVQSYRKSAGSGALQPVRAGTDMSLASQEAVMRSGLPDGTAARAQRDMSMAGVQRGRQAAELMAAGAKLNEMGGRNGVGTVDIIENRLVGMKSRGVYETPGGTILFAAHAGLEQLILDRDTTQYKNIVAQKFSQLVYDGLWYTPLREAISAFVDSTQQLVTGTVRMKLYKGSAVVAGRKAPYSLYNEEFATFSKDEVYNQSDAEGFINLFALPLKIRAIQKLTVEGGADQNEALERKVLKGGEFIR